MNNVFQQQTTKANQDSYEKGYLFEKFVISLFNEKNFKVQECRESKRIVEGATLLADHYYPDIELIFLGKKKYFFAVECKWRRSLQNGMTTWAKEHQIRRYEEFQVRKRIPVFIAIGIGGEPYAPEKLFVTPFEKIKGSSHVFESDLIPYKRKPSHKFFYDTVQLKLF
ncbi:MAG: hypothetical protein KF862_19675 [Chitinophagaceae bacterium]|nr:hypothetical protein [Chitinophagaceae bacterium]